MGARGVGLHLTNGDNNGVILASEEDDGSVKVTITGDQATLDRVEIVKTPFTGEPPAEV